MQMTLVLTPAYGKDYRSKLEIITAWNRDDDFESANLTTRYINRTDLLSHPHAFTAIEFRYNKLRSVAFFKIYPEHAYKVGG